MPHAPVFETCASADSATPAGEAQPRVASDQSQQREGDAPRVAPSQPQFADVRYGQGELLLRIAWSDQGTHWEQLGVKDVDILGNGTPVFDHVTHFTVTVQPVWVPQAVARVAGEALTCNGEAQRSVWPEMRPVHEDALARLLLAAVRQMLGGAS